MQKMNATRPVQQQSRARHDCQSGYAVRHEVMKISLIDQRWNNQRLDIFPSTGRENNIAQPKAGKCLN